MKKEYRKILQHFAELKGVTLECINNKWRLVYRQDNGFVMYHKIPLILYRDIIQTWEANGDYGLDNIDLPVWCCGV